MSNNNTQKLTQKIFLKKISIIHFAIIAGPLGFALVSYFNAEKTIMELTNPDNPYQFIIPISAITGYLFGNILFNQQIKKISSEKPISEKLQIYQTGFVFKLIALEANAIFGIIAFLENGNLFFLYISSILILLMILQKPNKQKIEAVLNLTIKQRSEFNNPDKILQ